MYPAHIRETGERQTVQEHCRNTAALAATALRPLGLEKSAYLAGLLHDAGKNKKEYEDYLLEAAAGGSVVRGSVNHTFAGVRFLLDRWHCGEGDLSYSDVTAELLAFAVGSHHGLFDCVDPQQHSGFFHRQTKEGIFYDESRQGFLAEVADEEELEHLFRDAVREMTPMLDRLAALSTQADDNEADRETAFYIGLLARMLLSAVIEGDRTDTATFMDGIEPPVFPEDMRPIWTERLAFMEKKLAAFPRKTPIDLARHTISDTCAAGAARPGGVYRLNVPTGGGKTLASLRFALTHAAKWNCSRIIFTAPLLSILDQNAQVIRDYIGDDALILEHHYNLAEPKETPERLQALELLTASWSAPIIITTLVQLLNTCFSGKTSAIRRFHALCGSVIVIDEVQTVPGKMLTLFNLAVNFLSEICGATIVLCSATQPCLEAADHPRCAASPSIWFRSERHCGTSLSAPTSKMPDVPSWRSSRRSSRRYCRRATVCWWCATRKRRRRSCSNRCKPRIAGASICPPPCACSTAGRLCKPCSPRWTSPPPTTGKRSSASPRR